MKAKIKLWENDGKTKNGYPVKLILYHQKKRSRKNITYTEKTDWDIIRNLPRPSHPDFENLYSKIMDMRLKSQKMEFKEINDFKEAYHYLLSGGKLKTNQSFYEFAETAIKDMKDLGREGNAKVYKTAADALHNFSPHLNFSEITDLKINEFKKFLQKRKLKNSSIRNYMSTIRAIYNRAVRDEIVEDQNPFKVVMKEIPIIRRRANNVYLNHNQLNKLKTADLPSGRKRAADLSLLQFYLCGVDFMDIYRLKVNQIHNGRVFLFRHKLGARAYEFDVKLTEEAKEIIERYKDPVKINGKLYLFPWIKFSGLYQTFISNQNRSLRKIKEELKIISYPKNEIITTKAFRHTFATLGKFARIEEDLLRELMGHERNDIDTIYKDKYPEAERDAAQEKIIKGF